MGKAVIILPVAVALTACAGKGDERTCPPNGRAPRNVIFILSDDHRYDYMGFLGTVPYLQTPNLDYLAANGAYVQNAFVTTSLSSPSRASILTGFFGKLHMGNRDGMPLPGFDLRI